jgi:heptosyltransferase-2
LEFSSVNKLLIIRLSSLGDILLTTPLIRSIKVRYPSIKIDFVVRDEYKNAISSNVYLENIHVYRRDRPNTDLVETLRSREYDIVADLQNNFRSNTLTQNLSGWHYKFKKLNIKKFLLVHTKLNFLKDAKQIPERYAEALGENILDDSGLDFFIPEGIEPSMSENGKYMGLCPGAQHFTKMWPEEYFVELGNKLNDMGYKVVLLGGNSDRLLCRMLQFKIKNSIDVSNENKLHQLAADMKMCKGIVCNDSGLMHLASALRIPLVTIFGSSVVEFGFTPYLAESTVLENDSLNCRPCSHVGKSACPRDHFNCMKKIKPDIVLQNLLEIIA